MPFDPLHKWLGIPAHEQPPNHYRLLGIPEFEDDAEVIDAAADKQLSFLHDLTNGPHAQAAEELSNRVSAARVCLCSQTKKAAYDDGLRRKASHAAKPASPPSRRAAPVGAGTLQSSPSPTSATTKQVEPRGWMLRHLDGIEHGPYPFESLVEAARRGRITGSTLIRHPVITGDQWQEALSVAGIAAACPASTAAVTADTVPASSSPAIMVAAAERTRPAPVSVRTRPKLKRADRSWIVSVIGTALPAVMLFALVGAIYRTPRLRQALVNVLSPQDQGGPQTIVETVYVEPEKRIKKSESVGQPKSGVEMEITNNGGRREDRQSTPHRTTGKRMPSEEPAIDFQTDATIETIADDQMHALRLDLSKTRWSAELEGAHRDDQFFVVGVEKVNTRLDMKPMSGALSFDEPTTLTFNSLNVASGLGMELTLATTEDPAKIKVIGRVVMDDDEFRLTNLKRRCYEVLKERDALIAKVNAATATRAKSLAIVNGSGTIDLAPYQQAKNNLVQIDLILPGLIQQRNTLQTLAFRMNAVIEMIEELNEKGELVICVRRFVEESDPSANEGSSLNL